MGNWFKYLLFGLVFFLHSKENSAQLIALSDLDSFKTYYSIEEAMVDPEAVYKLDLSKNKLKEFPEEILSFKNLNWLSLYKNKLVIIPGAIRELAFLQDLNLSNNRIDSLPEELFELKNLKVLRAAQNELTFLSANVNCLEALETLDLWSNNFDDFPKELEGLVNLKVLDVRVILLNGEVHENLFSWLPNTKIYISPPCNSCLD